MHPGELRERPEVAPGAEQVSDDQHARAARDGPFEHVEPWRQRLGVEIDG